VQKRVTGLGNMPRLPSNRSYNFHRYLTSKSPGRMPWVSRSVMAARSWGSDLNGARITQAFGSLELAANLVVSLFYASIYYLPSLDSLFCFSTGYREQMIGLRAALDGTRFIAVRSVTYPLLNDQVQ
jgi:hypothetical protein